MELPYDQGSLLAQLFYRADDIDLDYLDRGTFKVRHLNFTLL